DDGDRLAARREHVCDAGVHACLQIGPALPAGEAHLRRRLHPAAKQLRLVALDVLVRLAFELAEVEFAEAVVDARSAEQLGGLQRPPARAGVDGVQRESMQTDREPLGGLRARRRQPDVEPPVAASARVVLRLRMPDEEHPFHETSSTAARPAACASSVVAPSVSPVTPPIQRRKNTPSTSAVAAAAPTTASPSTPRTPTATMHAAASARTARRTDVEPTSAAP